MQGRDTMEQATVRAWAWREYGVAVRPAPLPPGLGAATVRCGGGGGVRARIVYRPDDPRWRAAVLGELAALVGPERAAS